jgi:hypothetical protein
MNLFCIKKGDIDLDTIGKWIISIMVLIIVLGSYFLLKDKMNSAIEYLINFLRF